MEKLIELLGKSRDLIHSEFCSGRTNERGFIIEDENCNDLCLEIGEFLKVVSNGKKV